MVREDPANTQPEFPSAVYRFLPEDTPDYKYVGQPVVADDADTGDVLTYTLDGTDKDSFYIANSNTVDDNTTDDVDEQALAGQIRVKVLTDLDHENGLQLRGRVLRRLTRPATTLTPLPTLTWIST